MSQDKKNINELLTALQAVSKESGYQIWIPSLKREVKFSDISTGQQKEMIRALVDNPVYRTNFILALHKILKDNCQDQIDIDTLTILDKVAIAVQIRAKSIGTKVKVETDAGQVTVDIADDYAKRFTFTTDPISNNFDFGDIQLSVREPTIGREVQLERELRSNLVKSTIENYDDVRNMLADAYVGELAKYITYVAVGDNKTDVTTLDFKQAYKVVEGLPATLVRKAIGYLEATQQVIATWLTFPVIDKDSDLKEAEITIDATFFAGK